MQGRAAGNGWILASILGFVAAFGGGEGQASAAFVAYTQSVVGTGRLGSTTFTDAAITITGTADTDQVSVDGTGAQVLVAARVDILNVGSATFTGQIYAIQNAFSQLAGFGDRTSGFFILGTTNAVFQNYDLRSSIGPVSGTSVQNLNRNFATTAGNIAITGVSGPGTFTAAVATGAVPEPSSLALVATAGALGLAARARRRR